MCIDGNQYLIAENYEKYHKRKYQNIPQLNIAVQQINIL